MSLERLSDVYYTAQEARTVLGLTEDSFQYWVTSGKIDKTVLPGMKRGVYAKREIDRKAHLIQAAMFLDTTRDLEFKQATAADVESEIHLAHLIYGKRVLKPEAQQARRGLVESNPESTWYLYDRETLAASINIVPLDQDAIAQFKQGVRGWLFVGTPHIRQFQPGSPLEVIVLDFMTSPTVPPEKRNFYALALLRELAQTTFRQWAIRGIEITKLYACGSTDSGRKLLRNRWFQELGEPVPGRVIFELEDVLHSDFYLLKPYQEAFTEQREQQNRLV